MIWRNPWAWAGLLCLALPVLIHLLSRAPASVRPFPSLRFVDPSRLSPRRRTRPRDVLLLLVRLGILTAAVAALAGPVLPTARRTGATRTVRAIVLDTSASMQRNLAGTPAGPSSRRLLDSASVIAAGAGDSAAVHTLVRTDDLHAGISGAAAWLAATAGLRELVVISDFQRGSLDSATLRRVPANVGVRLVKLNGAALPDTFTTNGNGTAGVVTRVRTLADGTEMQWSRGAIASGAPSLQLRVPPERRAAALAAYAAAMDASGAGTPESAGVAFERIAPTSRALEADDAPVQILYAERASAGGARGSVLETDAQPLRAPWMADLVVRIAADPLLRDIAGSFEHDAREGAREMVDTSRFTVVATPDGVPLVQAAQSSANAPAHLLLYCLADAGSPLSAALIAATSRAMASGVGDSAPNATAVRAEPAMTEREPQMLPDAEIAAWNRVPADSLAASAAALSATDAEQGGVSDARWFWALALALLAVEALMRRTGANT